VKAILWALVFVLAAASATLGILYSRQLHDETAAGIFSSADKTWMLSGHHLFDITDRSFDVVGLAGYSGGMDKWTPIGGPNSPYSPNFVPASHTSTITDAEYVLGVVNGGVATAYPLKVLAAHQVVNDASQTPRVLVYYGTVAHTAAAYAAPLDGKPLDFACSGYLYGNIDLLFAYGDEDCFMPLQGVFATGRSAGQDLERLPSAVLPLGAWRKLYPQSRLMTENTGIGSKLYPREDVLAKPVKLVSVTSAAPPARYADDAPVLILGDASTSVAVPFPAAKVAGRTDLPVTVGDKQFTVHFLDDWKAAYATDPSGALAPSARSIWHIYWGMFPAGKAAEVR
jgi:hypothetical protein